MLRGAGESSRWRLPLRAVGKSRQGLTAEASQPERQRESLQSCPHASITTTKGGGRGTARLGSLLLSGRAHRDSRPTCPAPTARFSHGALELALPARRHNVASSTSPAHPNPH